MNLKIRRHNLRIFFISLLLGIIYIYPLLQIEQFEGDFYKYQRDFNNLKDNYEWSRIFDHYELGFRVFSYPFAKLNITFHAYLFIVSVIFYFFAGQLMFKNSSHKQGFFFYFLMLFLFPFYFAYDSLLNVVIRQGLAVIVIFAFFFPDRDRGHIYFLIVSFIASLFHTSALIFFIVYVVSRFFKNMNFYVIFFLLSAILYITELPIFFAELLNMVIIKIFFFKSNLILFYDSNYKLGFSIYKFLATILPLFIYLLESKKNFSKNNKKKMLWQCYFFISSIGMTMSGLNYYDRVLIYSWIFIPILSLPVIEIFFKNLLYLKK
jgi:hypothetical protein